jgi:hypothetical protein
MFIYVIVNSETLKIYIGQHKGHNLRKYLQTKFSNAKRNSGKQSHLFASMKKYPKEAWSIHPLLEVQTKGEMDDWETLLIKALNARHQDVGYNICRGGEGHTGPLPEETKANLRKRYAECPEYRAQLDQTGRIVTAESRKKMSDSHLGQSRPQTETHKQRIGESNAKTWTPERRAAQAEQMKKNFRD